MASMSLESLTLHKDTADRVEAYFSHFKEVIANLVKVGGLILKEYLPIIFVQTEHPK